MQIRTKIRHYFTPTPMLARRRGKVDVTHSVLRPTLRNCMLIFVLNLEDGNLIGWKSFVRLKHQLTLAAFPKLNSCHPVLSPYSFDNYLVLHNCLGKSPASLFTGLSLLDCPEAPSGWMRKHYLFSPGFECVALDLAR